MSHSERDDPRLVGSVLLRRAYGVTEYDELFAGGSAFQAAFFDTRQGQCTAPVPGRGAYWILKVEKRSPTGRKVGTNEDLLRKMYVHDRFQKWVTATLGKVVLKVKPR